MCPKKNDENILIINDKNQHATIALGIYLLESSLDHVDRLLPYFMDLLLNLPNAVWIESDDYEQNEDLSDRK